MEVEQVNGEKKTIAAAAAERFLRAPFLADVDLDVRRVLLNALEEVRAPEGAILLRQGQQNDYLLFLIEGTAQVERSGPGRSVESLATLNAPAVFGTTSFFRAEASPTVTIRAVTDVWLLTLTHAEHERLRRHHPRAAEALALASVRVLAERFDLLDQRISDQLAQAQHADDHPRETEWSDFRARLFEEPGT